ncbi:MAG: hypothetical protein ACXW5U_06810 [Thermoanaerobaculia bacterium]
MANAAPFKDLRWSSKNSLDSCKATTWISTPHAANKTVTGMAYNWGGNNTIAEFNKAIAGTGYPGNKCTKTQGNPGLSKNTWGVDCSGFFGRIFGITGKLNTTMIRDMTVAVRGDRAGLRTGDILVKAGDHVAIYLSGTPTGAPLIVESSGYDWRVVQRTAKWSEFPKSYESKRYAQLQDAGIAKFNGMTAPTIRRGAKLVTNLTLRESDGNGITYDGIGLSIYNDSMTVKYGDALATQKVAFRGDEVRKFNFSVTNGLQPGTYRIIAIGKVGSRWTPFVPKVPYLNNTRFTITK